MNVEVLSLIVTHPGGLNLRLQNCEHNYSNYSFRSDGISYIQLLSYTGLHTVKSYKAVVHWGCWRHRSLVLITLSANKKALPKVNFQYKEI